MKKLTKVNKTRMLILTVIIGSVILILLKWMYPLTDLTQLIAIVTIISIIFAYLVEIFIGSKKST
jgi:hypothetical protein